MEVSEAFCQQDRLQLMAEKRKWQTEMENKRRQLEDDRRALQHLRSKALRERWLLDGAPSAGPEQDDVKRQLEQDEAKTRSLEEAINKLEQELVSLETGAVILEPTHSAPITHSTVTSGSVTEVKGHRAAPSGQVVQEVKVHKSPRMNKPREATQEMKRAMYSVEIKIERDRVTGETRVLSTNTTLPVDLSNQGVKVYEDEQKVVHEMNGEDGVHLLSSSEVEELIHKADEASMMSPTVHAVNSIPTVEVQEVAGPDSGPEPVPESVPRVAAEITGLEAKPGSEPSVDEASAENPVTMVFMGYQSVEDEDETKKVLGLQGTVKAELVHIDNTDGKTSPAEETDQEPTPPTTIGAPTTSKPREAMAAINGETAGEAEGGAVAIKKEKQPCKCCSIM